MNRRTATWHLPLRPRMLWPACVLVAAGFWFVAAWPDAVLMVGDQNLAPRPLNPFEYVPLAVAAALGLGLTTRFPQWDRYGSSHTRRLAVGCSVATVLIPLATFFALLTLYPSGATPPARSLVPIWSDITVASLLIVILIGTLGRLIGTLIWLAALYAIMLIQSTAPTYGAYLPLTIAYHPDLSLDTDIRWWWIIGLTITAGAVTWIRRNVPIRLSLRPAEEQ